MVEKDNIISGDTVAAGDALIGLASSGPHSNGYSLIRKIIEVSQADVQAELAGKPLAEHLMAPTRIYVKPLLALIEKFEVKALAHITGGGITENVPRVLPAATNAVIDTQSWQWPSVFKWLQEKGNVETTEMYRTFNCGVGMILAVPDQQAQAVVTELNALGEQAWVIGSIEASSDEAAKVVLQGL